MTWSMKTILCCKKLGDIWVTLWIINIAVTSTFVRYIFSVGLSHHRALCSKIPKKVLFAELSLKLLRPLHQEIPCKMGRKSELTFFLTFRKCHWSFWEHKDSKMCEENYGKITDVMPAPFSLLNDFAYIFLYLSAKTSSIFQNVRHVEK